MFWKRTARKGVSVYISYKEKEEEVEQLQKRWIVARLDMNDGKPFQSLEQAKSEAERLAKQAAGKSYGIFELICSYEVPLEVKTKFVSGF